MGYFSRYCDRLLQADEEKIIAHINEEFNVLLYLSCFYMKLDRKNRYWQTIYAIIMIILLTYHLVLFFVTAYITMDQLVILAFSLSIGINYLLSLFVMLYIMLTSRFYWHRFVRRCINNFYEYKTDEATDYTNKLREKGRKERIALLLVGPSGVGLCILFILFISPAIDKYSPVKLSLDDIPSSINRDLPVAVWFPIQIESKVVTTALSLLQIIAALPIAVILPASLSTYMFFVQQVAIQLELLIQSIERLEKRANRLMTKLFKKSEVGRITKRNPYFQFCVKECLKENVQHHHQILLGLNESYSIICTPLLVCNSLMTLMIAVSLTGFISSSSSYGFKAVSALTFVCELTALSLIHYYGQKLIDLNHALREKLYETNWKSYNKSIRSMLIIVFERTKRPLEITPLGLTSVKWEAFSKICNSAYTYTNLMMALES